MDLSHLITVEPGKRSGQPCIRGMRSTVRDVLEHLAGGRTVDDLLAPLSAALGPPPKVIWLRIGVACFTFGPRCCTLRTGPAACAGLWPRTDGEPHATPRGHPPDSPPATEGASRRRGPARRRVPQRL